MGLDEGYSTKNSEEDLLKTRKIIKIFLDNGANPNFSNAKNLTSILSLCVRKERYLDDIFDELIVYGAKLDDDYALADSIICNSAYYLEKLIGNKRNYLLHCYPYCTTLMLAAIRNSKDCAEFLIKNGDSLEFQIDLKPGKKSATALLYCFDFDYRSASYDVLDILVLNGADVNFQDYNGDTILHRIFSCTYYPKINSVELILQNEADLSLKNNMGKTAKEYICSENTDLIQLIEKYNK